MRKFGVGITGLFLVLMVISFIMLMAAGARAQETKAEEEAKPEKPQFILQTDIYNQYVFRGVALSRGSAVFQPSLTGSYKGFTVNIWGNFDTSEKNPFALKSDRRGPKWNETDFTVSYSYEVIKNLTLTAGFIYYLLDSNNSAFDQQEIYGGFGYKLPWFEFGFAAYREVGHFPGTYLQWYVTRSQELPWYGMSLDLWASWSAELSNDKAAFPVPNNPNKFYQSLHAGHLMATLNIPVGKYVKLAPRVMWWYALGGDSTGVISGLSWDRKHNHVLGGASIIVTF
ncbi:MAG: hypothetical protein FJ134_10805 [Deltaproteobacteria bacterium]|nr:hypothetical protein [Deltaproteobacteria bacterium]